jgi:hypothetical protein
VEHKSILSTIITEEMRWVHLGKGQVAQQDRVKTTMTVPDTGFLQPIKFHKMGAGPDTGFFTANIVPRNGCYHPTPMWNTNIAYL